MARKARIQSPPFAIGDMVLPRKSYSGWKEWDVEQWGAVLVVQRPRRRLDGSWYAAVQFSWDNSVTYIETNQWVLASKA